MCLTNLRYYGGVKILFLAALARYFGDPLFRATAAQSLGFGHKIEFGCSSYLKARETTGYSNPEGTAGRTTLDRSVEL